MSDPVQVSGFTDALASLCDQRLVQSMYSECDVLMEGVLLTLHGDTHAQRRAIELQLFRRDFARYYESTVLPGIVAQTLAPDLERGQLDLHEFGARVTLNLSARIAGLDITPASAAAEDSALLLRIVRKFGEGATLFHSTRDKNQVRQEVADALEAFDAHFLQPAWQRRKGLLEAQSAEDAPELPRDILTLLLSNQAEQGWDDALIRREVAFFMQAASHSSANALVHCFHELVCWCHEHPADWERVETDPLFLQRCVHEALRLHPASPVAWRTASCPFSLADGQGVETGESVVIDLTEANQESSLFGEDSHRFNPHRHVRERVNPYGLTFGVGIHTCFGRELAGGSLPKTDTNPDEHHFGTLTSILRTLLEHGATPDPDTAPSRDDATVRANWKSYPLIFTRRETS